MVNFKVALSGIPLLWFFATNVVADNHQHKLEALYHYAGIHTHLSQVDNTVNEEKQRSLQACSDEGKRPDIQDLVSKSIDSQLLKADYLKALAEQLSLQQIDQIIEWINSPLGKRIHHLEAESASIDEADLVRLISDYQSSSQYTPARTELIREMLANTGAANFISALNTEMSNTVSMASLCHLDKDTLASAQRAVRSARGEEGFYRAILRPDLLMPISVIFRSLSDDELNNFITFTQSDSGEAYYKALVQGTRTVLSSRVDRLEQKLEALLIAD